MIGYLKLGAIGLGVAAIIGVAAYIGGYIGGRGAGKAEVRAEWDQAKLVAAAAFQKAVSDKEAVERERDRLLKEISDDLKPKLVAANDSVAGLSRRLRLATASTSRCPVSEDSSAAGGDSEAGGVSNGTLEIERAADAAWAAAARDSARLTACQAAYESVRLARSTP